MKVKLIALAGAFAAGAYAASVIPLGDLPGGEFWSEANDVSADGKTVVGRSSGPNTSSPWGPEAFRWTANGPVHMVGLGPLSGRQANACSADGSVVVGETFRWMEDEGIVALSDLPGGNTTYWWATCISADGKSIVGVGHFGREGHAVRWTLAGGLEDLGTLLGPILSSTATGVSYDGSKVVGSSYSYETDWTTEPFLWTAVTGMVGLGKFPGASWSDATAISDDGTTVVGYAFMRDSPVIAFRWTATGGMVPLESSDVGDGHTFAFDVSADGSIVVGKTTLASM